MLFWNSIFTFEQKKYRLVHVDQMINRAWAMPLYDEKSWPRIFVWSSIQRFPAITEKKTPLVRKLTDLEEKKRDKAYSIVSKLVTGSADYDMADIFTARTRGPIVAKRAKEVPCSANSINLYLRRYWMRGQTPDALVPDYIECGGHKNRKRKNGKTYVLNDIDRENMRWFIRVYFRRKGILTIDAAYQRMLEKKYYYLDGNGERFINNSGNRPSIRQFRYFLETNYSTESRVRKIVGDKIVELNNRARLGTAASYARNVGDYYEIDATILDWWVVDDQYRNQIIGKLTLYLIIDAVARLIVGFYIGLERPSWAGAIEALRSISLDKQELCKRYGVKYVEAEWPAHEIFPKRFSADGGSDVAGYNSDRIVEGINIIISNLPSCRADWKPLVESRLYLIPQSIKADIPSFSPDFLAKRRQEKGYEKDACLTATEAGGQILEAIIHHNKSPSMNYPLSKQQMSSGVTPDPISLWNHGIANSAGVLRRMEESSVRMHLLPTGKAKISDKGFLFKNCRYICKEAELRGFFFNARNSYRSEIDVSFDSGLVNIIYIHSGEKDGAVWEAQLAEDYSQYLDNSFAQVKFWAQMRANTAPAIEQIQRQNASDRNPKVQKFATVAKGALADLPPKSRSAKRVDIKPAREANLQNERIARAPQSSRSEAPRLAQAKVPELEVKPAFSPDIASERRRRMLNEQ